MTTTTTTTLAPTYLRYTPGRIQVFLNGRRLQPTEYIATDGYTITLVTPTEEADILTVALLDIENLPSPSDFYYVFLGRTTEWEDDDAPPTQPDTRVGDAETKRNIMAVRRIQPTDASMMIPRIDWASGTTYPAYDDSAVIKNTPFYVMNSGYRIYKCIITPGTPSTVEPTHTTMGALALADGYTWQLIYEVPVSDRLKFLTADYIPVKFYSTSSSFDHTGLVDYLIITEGGTGYASAPSVYITGDGYGAAAIAEVSGGAVTKITVTDGGGGYSYALATIVGGDGNATAQVVLRAADLPSAINQGAASYAISTAGAINNIIVDDGGEGYINNGSTAVTIVGDGVGATARPPVISTDGEGRIIGIEIENQGNGYTFAEIEISSIYATTPAVARAVIEPQGGHGSNVPQELFSTVVGITVTLEDVIGDFFTANDFRQIGIITNLRRYDGLEVFTESTGNACYVVTAGYPAYFEVDDVITSDGGGRFLVVNKQGEKIFLLPLIDSLSLSSTLSNITQGVAPLFLTSLIEPEVSADMGNIIYVRNISPVERVLGQAEQLKLFFSF